MDEGGIISKTKRIIGKAVLFILCCMLLQPRIVCVKAAGESGLAASGRKLYYYENGQKVRNCWKKVDGHKYYFGKNGAAYMAPKAPQMSQNVVCKTIGGVKYCFDQKGHLVKKGVYADTAGNAFSVKNGKVDKARTKKIQKASEYLADARKIRGYLGKPKKTSASSSCFRDGGTDLMLTYPHVTLALYRDDSSGEELVLFLDPR